MRTNGSARSLSLATSCCFRAICCTQSQSMRVSGASRSHSTRSRHDWIRGATRFRLQADVKSLVSDSADAPAASDARPLASTPLALALMLMSGFAALGYQIVWTQQSALWLGHEAAAVLAVITAFFGGIALGAFFLGS